ncbi:SpoVR family protein [Desulfobacterales bacterium HSG16]|nr:SpoVR family protein [Desulfobacterales bacterium HSG16]
MELIDQHTKKIMEGCKDRAREAGLRFQDETLEYIVTNRDLIELSPKVMIPTLYDYWVHDVEVLKEKGKYELYPSNPYETVINTRPAISFYNDNNPDWLNVMIFYHVIGHIDFFQNNIFFKNTWDMDFTGHALSDKRMIARLRSEKGRWVDYIIEFTRSIDNLVGYHEELAKLNRPQKTFATSKLDFYFDVFLQSEKKVSVGDYVKEIERYNDCVKNYQDMGEETFFSEIDRKYPEFLAVYKKSQESKSENKPDIVQFIMDNSENLNKEENKWMKSVMQIIRKTSLFFQPQIRTKIMNEGWASYWHETLFLRDDRIKGHEVDFARVNAGVTAMPRVGLNPYALGMRLFYYLEDMANKGQYSFKYRSLKDSYKRKIFDEKTGRGKKFIFDTRENLCDFMFINTFIDQDFTDLNNLFVVGKRLNEQKMVWEYYVQSKSAKDYKNMVIDSLYHPPLVEVDTEKTDDKKLYLVHRFEDKPLVKEYIHNTMVGIEYLWGGPVSLETSEVLSISAPRANTGNMEPVVKWQRVVYTMDNRKISRKII